VGIKICFAVRLVWKTFSIQKIINLGRRNYKVLELVLDKREPTESISDYAYRVLRKNIIYLNIKPGESISENTVASALNVSRTPVRETFSRLVGDYLLEVYPQKGTYVPLIDMKRVRESFFMRIAMEDAIIKEACNNFPEEDLFLLESNLNQQVFCYNKNRFDEVFELDNQMHELIYKGCGMEHIWEAIRSISADQYRVRYLKLTTKIRWNETIEEHRKIIQAIKNKDSEAGYKIMHDHVIKLDSDVEVLKQKYPDFFKKD
jgi:GntR family transcriptional regulator, rspAB operon transcriptional repressor